MAAGRRSRPQHDFLGFKFPALNQGDPSGHHRPVLAQQLLGYNSMDLVASKWIRTNSDWHPYAASAATRIHAGDAPRIWSKPILATATGALCLSITACLGVTAYRHEIGLILHPTLLQA